MKYKLKDLSILLWISTCKSVRYFSGSYVAPTLYDGLSALLVEVDLMCLSVHLLGTNVRLCRNSGVPKSVIWENNKLYSIYKYINQRYMIKRYNKLYKYLARSWLPDYQHTVLFSHFVGMFYLVKWIGSRKPLLNSDNTFTCPICSY